MPVRQTILLTPAVLRAGNSFDGDEAKKNGWTVISMKNDWKQIFKWEQ
jgi:hypothetical protein